MSKEYTLRWSAHPNIYNSYSERELSFCFTEPTEGVNEETGILLLISGFGGNSNSKVYSKMRKQFSDQHNLVVVQCDYFGQEFMQHGDPLSLDMSISELREMFTQEEIAHYFSKADGLQRLLNSNHAQPRAVRFKADLNESLSNFNDMGIMQALDNLTALFYVIEILKDNDYTFNTKKVIVYGHSHGSYLAYLCNAFYPGLFTLLIDNSSWLFPNFLKKLRGTSVSRGLLDIQIMYHYLATEMDFDPQLLHLKDLYRQVNNKCIIQSFHGSEDILISLQDKLAFCNEVSHCTLEAISEQEALGPIFKSAHHGLDADFLLLFDHVMNKTNFDTGTELIYTPNTIQTEMNTYQFSIESAVPLLHIVPSPHRT
ncbi:DUF2920 family protein [Paenibacillus sp. CF384]|uniref:DUF2920 family protein n=1 Tax=Paenibacillus sp. CF384 TaxID=1884382 RepID=UPI00089727E6|nr:DUF2920 family protein [Paenibacillus sp. CF384]SDX28822.1 Protein of unknown function [Paenibacillus sp. CF384]